MRRSWARLASQAWVSSSTLRAIERPRFDRPSSNVPLDPIHANAKLETSRSRTRDEGNRVQPAASITVSHPMEARAAVLLPLPLPVPYDYALPAGIVPHRCRLVRAPLGPRAPVCS